MVGGKRWEGHPQVFADILVRYVSKHSWFEYRDQVEPKKATKTRNEPVGNIQELLRLRCLWEELQKLQPNLLFNDKEVKQALERVLFEKKWFEAEADKEKAQSWTKDFSNWIRAALRDSRQSQLLSPNTAWLRKLWGEGEHDTGCGHDAAETIIDAADEEEGWAITVTDGCVFRKRGSITEEGKICVPTAAQAFGTVRAAWPDGSDNEVVDVCVDEFMRMKPAELEEPGA